MNDYNIEFGHIYIDQDVGIEQTRSLQILEQTIADIGKSGESYSSVILVDDYSPDSARLDIGAYADSHGKLDFLFLESTLAIFKDKMLKDIDADSIFESKGKVFLKKSDHNNILLIKENGKPTCHFLIAIWFLARLGIYSEVTRWGVNLNNKDFPGKQLITILSQEYQKSDSKALDIIAFTKYKDRLKDIRFIYFDV